MISLEDLPEDTAFLSAKTAWTLRRRVPVALMGAVLTTANFTGDNSLSGGDIAGNDNVVNTLDFSVLRRFIGTEVTGPG